MKMFLMIAVTLVSGSVFAANDSIKICNPDNKSQSFEITVQDGMLNSVNAEDGKPMASNSAKIEKVLELTQMDLLRIYSDNNLKVALVSGTAYSVEDGALAIVTDKNGVKYMVLIMPPMMKVSGNSDSCK
jgi:hypothetical protein